MVIAMLVSLMFLIVLGGFWFLKRTIEKQDDIDRSKY
jgi:hypothetical protein